MIYDKMLWHCLIYVIIVMSYEWILLNRVVALVPGMHLVHLLGIHGYVSNTYISLKYKLVHV